MKLRTKSALRIFLVSFALITITTSAADKREDGTYRSEIGAATLSISGRIILIEGKSFTISTEHAKSPGEPFQRQQASSMTFLINSNTKIMGNLAVGSDADVTYERQGGNNVAVTVNVTAAS